MFCSLIPSPTNKLTNCEREIKIEMKAFLRYYMFLRNPHISQSINRFTSLYQIEGHTHIYSNRSRGCFQVIIGLCDSTESIDFSRSKLQRNAA